MVDLLDRATGAAQVVGVPDRDLSPVGWRLTEAGLRALLLGKRRETGGDPRPSLYLADPATGSAIEVLELASARERFSLLSPDGRRIAEIRDRTTLIVTDRATGQQREFTFHEDDRPYVREESIRWVGPEYLQFDGRRLALIDVSTMKMNLPCLGSPADIRMIRARFSPDLAWIGYQEDGNGDGLFLGRVALRQNDHPDHRERWLGRTQPEHKRKEDRHRRPRSSPFSRAHRLAASGSPASVGFASRYGILPQATGRFADLGNPNYFAAHGLKLHTWSAHCETVGVAVPVLPSLLSFLRFGMWSYPWHTRKSLKSAGPDHGRSAWVMQ